MEKRSELFSKGGESLIRTTHKEAIVPLLARLPWGELLTELAKLATIKRVRVVSYYCNKVQDGSGLVHECTKKDMCSRHVRLEFLPTTSGHVLPEWLPVYVLLDPRAEFGEKSIERTLMMLETDSGDPGVLRLRTHLFSVLTKLQEAVDECYRTRVDKLVENPLAW